MQLDNLPVFGGQGFDVDGMRQWRIDVDNGGDLLAVGQSQCGGQSRIDLNRGDLLIPSTTTGGVDPVSSDYGRYLALAGHASPAEVYGALG